MEEKIYTIPVTQAFEKKEGCPFCRLRRELEDTERELIMGASMMEPDIRIKTNAKGFCHRHYQKMFAMNNRLSLALMLESHLNEQADKVAVCKKSLFGKTGNTKAVENIKTLSSGCYICERVEEKYAKMISTAVLLWQTQTEFRTLLAAQPYFCLPHAAAFLETAKIKLDKKRFPVFAEALDAVQSAYMQSLSADVSWFCKKFDYRYENEPWGNAKDSVERAIKFLSGDID
ncbi:MAG: DUF6062 family protein [Eubacteriales bacterium]